jgi:hypothetical protein
MSENNRQTFAFPQRTPVFTALVVLVGLLLFAWLIERLYHPPPPLNPRELANPADFPEDAGRWKLTPGGRAGRLAELRQHEHDLATTYGIVDAKAGVYRIPIDEAIKLTARDSAKK